MKVATVDEKRPVWKVRGRVGKSMTITDVDNEQKQGCRLRLPSNFSTFFSSSNFCTRDMYIEKMTPDGSLWVVSFWAAVSRPAFCGGACCEVTIIKQANKSTQRKGSRGDFTLGGSEVFGSWFHSYCKSKEEYWRYCKSKHQKSRWHGDMLRDNCPITQIWYSKNNYCRNNDFITLYIVI